MSYVNRVKRSGEGSIQEAGRVPVPAELIYGEIGINTHDGKLYLKRSSGGGGPNIVQFSYDNPDDFGEIFENDHGTILAPVTVMRDYGSLL